MKIRFYPKTSTVIGILKSAHSDAVAQLDIAVSNHTELSNKASTGGLYLPTLEQDRKVAEERVVTYSRLCEEIGRKLTLLESHEPPEVMAEIDL